MSTTPTLPGPRRPAPTAARRVALSKPDLSRLILGGTASGVALVLFAWLLLARMAGVIDRQSLILAGFVQPPAASRAIAFPDQDVHALNGRGRGKPEVALSRDSFAKSVAALLDEAGGKPVVIYLSAVGVAEGDSGSARAVLLAGGGTGAAADGRIDMKDLIGILKEKGKGPKLLLIDPGHVASDRDLKVFGNSFLKRLEPLLESAPDVAVIAACAPGQMSWTSEAEKRSAFGYFVEQGLAGKAAGWNGRVTVQGLLDYIQPRVASWVAEHRGGAVQTPVRIGDSRLDFELPAMQIRTVPEKPEVRKTADAKKALQAAWADRERLAASRPYRFAPLPWTRYQDQLFRAERLFRAGVLDEVGTVLAGAASLRDEVARTLDGPSPSTPRSRAMLRRQGPATREADEFRKLNYRLLASFDAPPAAEPGPADKKPPGPAAPPAAAAGGVLAEDLAGLSAYIEGQPLAWYDSFRKQGGESDSLRVRRLQTLRKAVDVRFLAEEAAAADERIAPRIRSMVDRADALRREAQDDLFGGDESLFDRADALLAEARTGYDQALRIAGRLLPAVDLVERVSAEVPAFGEWQARRPEGVGDDLDAILDGAIELADQLDQPQEGDSAIEKWSASVADRAGTLKSRLDELGRSSRQAAKSAATGSTDWRSIDALLRVPSLPPEDRMALLDRVRSDDLSPPFEDASAASAPVDSKKGRDPTFWKQSIDLAELESKLLLLGGSGRLAGWDDVSAALRLATQADRKEESAAAFDNLDLFSGRVRALWALMVDLGRSTAGPEAVAELPEPDLRKALARADRAARVLPASAFDHLDSVLDPSRRFAEFSLHSSLAWQARRLCEDFAPDDADLLLVDARGLMETREVREASLRSAAVRDVSLSLEGVTGQANRGRQVDILARQRGVPPSGVAAVFLARKSPVAAVPLDRSAVSPMLKIPIASEKGEQIALLPARALDGEVLPKIFYRGKTVPAVGHVKLRGGAEELVSVDIRQYYPPGTKPSDVADQFLEHPRKGFIHPKDTLMYKVVITNKSGRELELFAGGKMGDRVRFQKALTLPAGGSNEEIVDTIGPYDFTDPKKDVMSTSIMLNVQVTEGDQDGPNICRPVEVEFRMIHPLDFIKIRSPGFGYAFNKQVGETMAYVVFRVDHLTDPVKVPAEVSVRLTPVEAVLQDNRFPASQRIPQHKTREFGFWILKAVPEVSWEIDVEGVSAVYKGVYSLNEKKPVPPPPKDPNAPPKDPNAPPGDAPPAPPPPG